MPCNPDTFFAVLVLGCPGLGLRLGFGLGRVKGRGRGRGLGHPRTLAGNPGHTWYLVFVHFLNFLMSVIIWCDSRSCTCTTTTLHH